jgi:HSP20 family protein
MSTLIVRRHVPSFADLVYRPLTRPVARPVVGGTAFGPAAEVVRDGADAVVRIDLPGVDVENDVTVEVVDNALVVRGERRDERGDAARGYREVRYGSFRRSFALPAGVGTDAVSASYDAGVLTVRIADAYATSQPTRIPVSAGTAKAEQAEQPEQAQQAEQPEQA